MKKAYWFALLLLACVTSFAFWRVRRPAPLTDTDYVVLGAVTNRSGDPVFDDSLREALRIALSQSPHLNLITDEKIRDVLRKTGKPENSRSKKPGSRLFVRSWPSINISTTNR